MLENSSFLPIRHQATAKYYGPVGVSWYAERGVAEKHDVIV